MKIPNLSKWVEERILAEYGSANSLREITENILETEKELNELRSLRNQMETETAKVDAFVTNMVKAIENPEREMRNVRKALDAYKLVIQADPVLSDMPKDELAHRIEVRLQESRLKGRVEGYQ